MKQVKTIIGWIWAAVTTIIVAGLIIGFIYTQIEYYGKKKAQTKGPENEVPYRIVP